MYSGIHFLRQYATELQETLSDLPLSAVNMAVTPTPSSGVI